MEVMPSYWETSEGADCLTALERFDASMTRQFVNGFSYAVSPFKTSSTIVLTRYDNVRHVLSKPHKLLGAQRVGTDLLANRKARRSKLMKSLIEMHNISPSFGNELQRKYVAAILRTTDLTDLAKTSVRSLVSRLSDCTPDSDLFVTIVRPAICESIVSILGIEQELFEILDGAAEELRFVLAPSDGSTTPDFDLVDSALEQAVNELSQWENTSYEPLWYRNISRSSSTSIAVHAYILLSTIAVSTTTTATAICAATRALLNGRSKVPKEDLGNEMIWDAMRLVSPVPTMCVSPTVPVSVEDIELSVGDSVLLVLAAAHRDADVFNDPFSIRSDRNVSSLVFGHGLSRCPGENIATAMSSEAIKTLVPFMSSALLTTGKPKWSTDFGAGLERLPIRKLNEKPRA